MFFHYFLNFAHFIIKGSDIEIDVQDSFFLYSHLDIWQESCWFVSSLRHKVVTMTVLVGSWRAVHVEVSQKKAVQEMAELVS